MVLCRASYAILATSLAAVALQGCSRVEPSGTADPEVTYLPNTTAAVAAPPSCLRWESTEKAEAPVEAKAPEKKTVLGQVGTEMGAAWRWARRAAGVDGKDTSSLSPKQQLEKQIEHIVQAFSEHDMDKEHGVKDADLYEVKYSDEKTKLMKIYAWATGLKEGEALEEVAKEHDEVSAIWTRVKAAEAGAARGVHVRRALDARDPLAGPQETAEKVEDSSDVKVCTERKGQECIAWKVCVEWSAQPKAKPKPLTLFQSPKKCEACMLGCSSQGWWGTSYYWANVDTGEEREGRDGPLIWLKWENSAKDGLHAECLQGDDGCARALAEVCKCLLGTGAPLCLKEPKFVSDTGTSYVKRGYALKAVDA